jgi:hypothetical protein
MAKYKYKGTDIGNLISSGSTSLTNYTGFPTYVSNTYSTEKPLPFKFNFKNPSNNYVDVSTLMDAKSQDYSSGSSLLTIPTDYNAFRAIIIGGGGGGGGGGGCGWKTDKSRSSAQDGGSGGDGKFIMIENTTPITSPTTISYSVGGGGAFGTGGGDRDKGDAGDNYGPGGKGNKGYAGNASYITATIDGTEYTIYANGGKGGNGGDAGGPGSAQGESGNPAPSSPNTYGSIKDYSASIPTDVNPLNYNSNIGDGGGGGGGGLGNGSPGGTGKPGYIRIYLLKS